MTCRCLPVACVRVVVSALIRALMWSIHTHTCKARVFRFGWEALVRYNLNFRVRCWSFFPLFILPQNLLRAAFTARLAATSVSYLARSIAGTCMWSPSSALQARDAGHSARSSYQKLPAYWMHKTGVLAAPMATRRPEGRAFDRVKRRSIDGPKQSKRKIKKHKTQPMCGCLLDSILCAWSISILVKKFGFFSIGSFQKNKNKKGETCSRLPSPRHRCRRCLLSCPLRLPLPKAQLLPTTRRRHPAIPRLVPPCIHSTVHCSISPLKSALQSFTFGMPRHSGDRNQKTLARPGILAL